MSAVPRTPPSSGSRLHRLAHHVLVVPAALGGSTTAPSNAVKAAGASSGEGRKMGFGIIGAGSIARSSFPPALAASGHAELVAVSRRQLAAAEKFAADFNDAGCTAYDDVAALLADPRVDAVVIATPGDSHAEHTLAAAALGKHVLVGKFLRNSCATLTLQPHCRTVYQYSL